MGCYQGISLGLICCTSKTNLQNREDIKQEIDTLGKGVKGECRARRAGSILDISSDGYYNIGSCLPDFEKVGQLALSAKFCKLVSVFRL